MPNDDLLTEREKTHGDWTISALIQDNFQREIIRWAFNMPISQRQALLMIAVKMARILSGDPSHADHWNDIAGYAQLGRDAS